MSGTELAYGAMQVARVLVKMRTARQLSHKVGTRLHTALSATHTDTLSATHTDTLSATHTDTLSATHTLRLSATHTDTVWATHTGGHAAADSRVPEQATLHAPRLQPRPHLHYRP
eukprot:1892720-Rhodomonas_salina.2